MRTTPHLLPSGAASHLDPFERPARFSALGDSFEEEAGEVAGLWNGEQDGVIAALAEALEDPDGDAGVACGGPAHLLEERRRDMVRAREGREHAAGLEQAEPPDVDLLVATRRCGQRVLAPREGRGIEDDGSEALACSLEAPQEIEGIALSDLGPGAQPIELEVAPREGERAGRGIEEKRLPGSPGEGVAGEGARIAEAVEDPAASRMVGEEGAVLALVQVEPGLVTGARGDCEAAAALGHDELLARRVVLRLEPFEPRRRRGIRPVDAALGKEAMEPVGDGRGGPRHAEGEALDDADRAIPIHYATGQAIRLAPHQAVGFRGQARFLAVFEGVPQSSVEESGVNGLVAAGQQPTAEGRARGVEAAAEEAAGPVHDLDGLLGLPPSRELGDLGAVDPWVAGLDPGLGTPRELERGHRGGG